MAPSKKKEIFVSQKHLLHIACMKWMSKTELAKHLGYPKLSLGVSKINGMIGRGEVEKANLSVYVDYNGQKCIVREETLYRVITSKLSGKLYISPDLLESSHEFHEPFSVSMIGSYEIRDNLKLMQHISGIFPPKKGITPCNYTGQLSIDGAILHIIDGALFRVSKD